MASTIHSTKQKERNPLSATTKTKASTAKAYIENKYSKRRKENTNRKQEWGILAQCMDELNLNSQEQTLIREGILHKEAEQMREKRTTVSVFDFTPLKIIGKGAFGEVRLVRHKDTQEVLALKKMKEEEILHRNQVQHVQTERDILASSDIPG